MEYVKIVNGEIVSYPYTINDLRADHPNTSFPESISSLNLDSYGVFKVTQLEQPDHDELREKLVRESIPVLIDSEWCVGWSVVELSAEELLEKTLYQKQLRQAAFYTEADPLFFKWQSEEGAKEEWLEKRQEIRDRYPYPTV